MTLSLLDWDAADGPPPDSVAATDVTARIAARGLIAPNAYAAFAAAHGGKRFASGSSRITSPDTGAIIGISTIFHYAGNQPRSAATDIWAQVEGALDPRLVPIATTNFSDLNCLDYRAGVAPEVVSYDFEAAPGSEIVLLATDFDAFLRAIGETV